MVLFRRLLGDVLRRHRQRQERTLRDVAAANSEPVECVNTRPALTRATE